MKSLTRPELNALLFEAKKSSELDWLLLLVTFNHGLRISEALALTKDNLVGNFLVVQRLKGSRRTSQPLLPSEREALLALTTVSGRFFPIDRRTADRRIKRYGKAAGIPAFKLHMHALKHTTGRLGYEGGMGVPELQSYLGHVNGKNTMVYLEASEEQAAAAFAAAAGGGQ
jgi:integrase